MRVTYLFFLGLFLVANTSLAGEANTKAPVANVANTVEVYRSAGCGCCGKWIEHLKNNQFNVIDHVLDNVDDIKKRYGVTPELASCHTAIVNGYVVEGHVPASDINKLLAQKPKVLGITAPGMPMGTPGMEMDGKKDAYQVLSFDKDHQTKVFSEYGAQ